ncbi:TPA: succinyl-diaminopimelate desuccinylase [Candidatus Poribacteria bacterium]|nr:succinyl-diaminopimelate desuccinylase [Candidatus Poribacteria bacterium]HIC03222.1 succinyl-diaminopimelate desuccinylase [Candidatus Poribacteria bacterium]HIN28222.1 succinyl-diaminopimelate desuccinylase [Candidatus Poribacteria bacterium]HIO81258.1 succinyl-diaminopimelate desuccinylase [Candidatus Poribacteria bacterium]
MIPLLIDLLNIPSPTFQEEKITNFIQDWIFCHVEGISVKIVGNSRIFSLPMINNLPHIGLVGHTDVVPQYFEVYQREDLLFGAGASDMKGALAPFMMLMESYSKWPDRHLNFSFILYCAEEGTPLEENGLYHLISAEKEFLRTLDLAIVGEPTNGCIQVGCVGSLHAEVIVRGVACHSARPWDGENALYKALPFIRAVAEIQPLKKTVFDVDFFDVISVTESKSENGRTSIPGQWICNINYRYAPGPSMQEAETEFGNLVESTGFDKLEFKIIDHVPSAQVIETDLFSKFVSFLGRQVEAKQAWTDVAQLNGIGIPAFNFGPGLTQQAHKANEYICLRDVADYYEILHKLKKIY